MHEIEVWTIQMSKWRKAKALDIELVDITVKSGSIVFAPTWDLVRLVKQQGSDLAEAEALYTEQYLKLMRTSWSKNRVHWEELLGKSKIALACYCGAGEFCHRKLLVGYLTKAAEVLGIKFVYKGELE